MKALTTTSIYRKHIFLLILAGICLHISAPRSAGETTMGLDHAGNYQIIPNTFTNLANRGFGYEPWQIFSIGPSAVATLADSTEATGNINSTNSRSFKFYGGPGGVYIDALRLFNNPLSIGDSFSVNMAYNWNGGSRGMSFYGFDMNFMLHQMFYVQFGIGDELRFGWLDDGGIVLSTTYSPTTIIHIAVTLINTNLLQVNLTRNDGFTTNLFSGSIPFWPAGVKFFNGGHDGNNNNFALYVNDLTITSPSMGAQPQIAVLGTVDLVPIPNNALEPNVSNGTDFGLIPTNSILMRDFYIANTGDAPLQISGIMFTPPSDIQDGGFDVSHLTPIPSVIDAGGTTNIKIFASPNLVQVYTSIVTILHNDLQVGAYSFALRAEGIDVTTDVVNPMGTNIYPTSAVLGGDVESEESIIERGTVWSITESPTMADNPLAEGGAETGTFSHRRMLPPGVTIYFRAYAITASGVYYSDAETLTTPMGGHVWTFDSNNAGWGLYDPHDPGAVVSWQSTGGNPGGHVRLIDPAGGVSDRFKAPLSGDWSIYTDGRMLLDLRLNHVATSTSNHVWLAGDGKSIAYSLSPLPTNAWRRYTNSLTAVNGFLVGQSRAPTKEELGDVLRNLDSVSIRADWRSGIETTQLDNVRFEVVLPAPQFLGTNSVSLINSASPSLVSGTDFGHKFIGASYTNTFTITNSSHVIMAITNIVVSGDGSSQYQFHSSPSVIGPGNTASMDVVYTPLYETVSTTSVTFAHNLPGSPFTIHIHGKGISLLSWLKEQYLYGFADRTRTYEDVIESYFAPGPYSPSFPDPISPQQRYIETIDSLIDSEEIGQVHHAWDLLDFIRAQIMVANQHLVDSSTVAFKTNSVQMEYNGEMISLPFYTNIAETLTASYNQIQDGLTQIRLAMKYMPYVGIIKQLDEELELFGEGSGMRDVVRVYETLYHLARAELRLRGDVNKARRADRELWAGIVLLSSMMPDDVDRAGSGLLNLSELRNSFLPVVEKVLSALPDTDAHVIYSENFAPLTFSDQGGTLSGQSDLNNALESVQAAISTWQQAQAESRQFDMDQTALASSLQDIRSRYLDRIHQITGVNPSNYPGADGQPISDDISLDVFLDEVELNPAGELRLQIMRIDRSDSQVNYSQRVADDMQKRIAYEQQRFQRVARYTTNSLDRLRANDVEAAKSTAHTQSGEWKKVYEWVRKTNTVVNYYSPFSSGSSRTDPCRLFSKNLRVISCFPDPNNPETAVRVYEERRPKKKGLPCRPTRSGMDCTVRKFELKSGGSYNPGAERSAVLQARNREIQARDQLQIQNAESTARVRNLQLDKGQAELQVGLAAKEAELASQILVELNAEVNRLISSYYAAQTNLANAYFSNPAYRLLRDESVDRAQDNLQRAKVAAYEFAKRLEYDWAERFPRVRGGGFINNSTPGWNPAWSHYTNGIEMVYQAVNPYQVATFLKALKVWDNRLRQPAPTGYGASPGFVPNTALQQRLSVRQHILNLNDFNEINQREPATVRQDNIRQFRELVKVNTLTGPISGYNPPEFTLLNGESSALLLRFPIQLLGGIGAVANYFLATDNQWNQKIKSFDFNLVGGSALANIGGAGDLIRVHLAQGGVASLRKANGEIIAFNADPVPLDEQDSPTWGKDYSALYLMGTVNNINRSAVQYIIDNNSKDAMQYRPVAATDWRLYIENRPEGVFVNWDRLEDIELFVSFYYGSPDSLIWAEIDALP